MTLDLQRQRAMDDLLEAERTMCARNESMILDLQQVLMGIAVRLDGERFESMRRGDPSIPSVWSAAEWKTFFDQVSLPGRGWNAPELKFQREQREYLQQIEGLKAQIKTLESEQEHAKPVTEATPIAAIPDPSKSKAMPRTIVQREGEPTPPIDDLIKDVMSIMESLPTKVPAPFDKVLAGGNRTGENAEKALKRYWIMAYLIGRWGLASSMEMNDAIVSKTTGVQPGAGSLNNIVDDLVGANIVAAELLKAGFTSLRLLRFSSEGEQLFEKLFHAKPVENEWARIIRLHEGEREPQHTMSIIAFAIHARKRGYSTRVLPENKETTTPPDLWISRDGESLYVEIELSQKENPAKWHNQAKLNNGKVAICAGTTAQRDALVSDCKAMHLTGYATDMESMVVKSKGAKSFKNVTPDDPFWLEVW